MNRISRVRMLVVIACTCLIAPAFAGTPQDWRVEVVQDPAADRHYRQATITDAQGNSFSIFRRPSGAVWAAFRLGGNRAFSANKLPLFQVDDLPAHDLREALRTQQLLPNAPSFEWQAQQVSLRVWHGVEKEGLGSKLIEFLRGKSLYFEYVAADGGLRKLWFPLEGGAPVITSVLGIDPDIDYARQDRMQQVRQMLGAAHRQCVDASTTRSEFETCRERVGRCGQGPQDNPDKLKTCLAAP